jgi:hypothetical protein
MHSSLNITRVIKLRILWAGHVNRTEEGRNTYRNLARKPERKRSE